MELFRLMAFGILVFGCVAFSQVDEAAALHNTKKRRDTSFNTMNLDPENTTVWEHIEKVEISFPKFSYKRLKYRGMTMRIRDNVRTIELNLHLRDSMLVSNKTPVYWVNVNNSKPDRVDYVLQKNIMNETGQLLEDHFHRASVILHYSEGTTPTVVGVIGKSSTNPGIVIRTLPYYDTRLHEFRQSRSIDEDTDWITIHAMARKLEDTEGHEFAELMEREKRAIHENAMIHGNHNNSASAEPRPPDALYPKILIAADSSYFRIPDTITDQLYPLEYLLVLFNTIDLYLRHLEHPAIRLHIAAITIATSRPATPYIFKNRFWFDEGFYYSEAINDMSHYFYNMNNRIPVKYDIAFALTELPMVGRTLGASRHGGACRVSNGQMEGVVLHHESGKFHEIVGAIHELGHLFGLPAEKNSSELPFSTDLQDVFDGLLNNGTLSCMYEKPEGIISWSNFLNPHVASQAEQCLRLGFTEPCLDIEDQCSMLLCLTKPSPGHTMPAGWCELMERPAAPGTLCRIDGDPYRGYCRENRCISASRPH